MPTDLPFEDLPPAKWRRFTSREEAEAALPGPSLRDPLSVGMMFLNALEDHVHHPNALLTLTTPESHPAWGDFSETAEMLRSIDDYGVGSVANRAVDAPDVAYVKVFRGVTQPHQVLDEQPVPAAAVMTLVWRPELDRWVVHAMGGSLPPEYVPRTA
jgi:hypothetical protein